MIGFFHFFSLVIKVFFKNLYLIAVLNISKIVVKKRKKNLGNFILINGSNSFGKC